MRPPEDVQTVTVIVAVGVPFSVQCLLVRERPPPANVPRDLEVIGEFAWRSPGIPFPGQNVTASKRGMETHDRVSCLSRRTDARDLMVAPANRDGRSRPHDPLRWVANLDKRDFTAGDEPLELIRRTDGTRRATVHREQGIRPG